MLMALTILFISEIVKRILHLEEPPFRPHFVNDSCPLAVQNIIISCWSEFPNVRPSLSTIKNTMRTNG